MGLFAALVASAAAAAAQVEGVQKRCIIHRDLKTENCLVTDYVSAKIADFGTSRAKGEDDVTMTSIGTPLYVAPEVVTGEFYDEKVPPPFPGPCPRWPLPRCCSFFRLSHPSARDCSGAPPLSQVDVYSFGMCLIDLATDRPILDFIGDRWCEAFKKSKAPKNAMRMIRPMQVRRFA